MNNLEDAFEQERREAEEYIRQAREKRLRVCSYARVSTDRKDQKNSFKAQVQYFERELEKCPNWINVGVFKDEGKSGTSRAKRDDFNRMIEKAKAGEIDLIITKELSRFSRNLQDTVNIVNELRQINVDVWFLANGIRSGTWLIVNAVKQEDDDWLLFGYCHIFEWEWGYVLLSELQNTKVKLFGYSFPLERDLYVKEGATVKDLI